MGNWEHRQHTDIIAIPRRTKHKRDTLEYLKTKNFCLSTRQHHKEGGSHTRYELRKTGLCRGSPHCGQGCLYPAHTSSLQVRCSVQVAGALLKLLRSRLLHNLVKRAETRDSHSVLITMHAAISHRAECPQRLGDGQSPRGRTEMEASTEGRCAVGASDCHREMKASEVTVNNFL